MKLFFMMSNKYQKFKKYHKGFLNSFFHFLSVVIQLSAVIYILMNFDAQNLLLGLMVCVAAPFIFDLIGHLLAGNLREILKENEKEGTINVTDANGFENAYFKVKNFIEYLWKI